MIHIVICVEKWQASKQAINIAEARLAFVID
jgi:hypothetical protein